jgi:hypothetical protein
MNANKEEQRSGANNEHGRARMGVSHVAEPAPVTSTTVPSKYSFMNTLLSYR